MWTALPVQGEKTFWRMVRCIHVFGLSMQRVELLALMKSADRLPDHVNALKALWTPGFADPWLRAGSSSRLITSRVHDPGRVEAGRTDLSWHRWTVGFLPRHQRPRDASRLVGQGHGRHLGCLPIQEAHVIQARHPVARGAMRRTAVAPTTSNRLRE